jgi:glycosyltransferase involved in cell wall biosynthesis
MNRVRRVLMIVENLPVPGDRRVWYEAAALRDQGYQVSIICPKGTKHYQESYIRIENIDIYRYKLPSAGQKYLAYVLEYSISLFMTFCLSLKVFFRQGFDVIHACNPPDIFFTIGIFYRLFGKKFVFDHHDLVPELFQIIFKGNMKPLYKILLFLERYTHKVAHLVIVTNLSQKRITGRSGCPPHKMVVVRSGPDLDRLRTVTLDLSLKGGRRYLLAYIGVMGAQDGVEYTLYALDELIHKRGRQDVSLVLMGDGDHAPALHTLAHQLQLEPYINFAGWATIEDLVRYLTVADIGLSPDPQNGLNEFCTMIKTMDYMAMGKPVVAFDLTETRVSAQGAALYATPNNLQDFADKIEILLDNEDLRRTMGAIGRARIVDELQWEHHKKYLLRAYEALFQGSSPSPRRNFLMRGTKNAEISATICQEVEDGDCAAPHLLQLAHEKALSCWEE